MKTKHLLLAILAFCTFSVFSQTPQEKEVLTLSKKKFSWLVNKQLDSLGNVLDEQLMFIHSSGWTETKQEILADLQSGKLTYKNIDVLQSSVRLFGDCAVVTGKGKFVAVADGKELIVDLMYTEVYVKKKKQWLLASRHANRL